VIRNKFFLLVFSVLALVLAVMAYRGNVTYYFHFLWRGPFHLFIRILLVLAFAVPVFRWITHRAILQKPLKLIYGIIFLPLVLLPFLRCSFRVPFVFCSICPTKCPWGISRGFMVNSFIALNLFGKSWCSGYCPLGTYQECQSQISKRHFKLPLWGNALPYVILAFAGGLYVLTLVKPRAALSFLNGYYEWVGATAAIATAIFLLAFFIPKFWCRYFCPIGAIAQITLRRTHST
jgi:polyferredoxin